MRLNVRGSFFRKWARLGGGDLSQAYDGDEPPLRSDLFSADQMEQHGKLLAGGHQLKSGIARDRLLARLGENEILLLGSHNLLTEDVKADRRITPAGEWLLDNFYLIEEQIRTARRHLPKGFSRELPCLQYGPSAGLPRVYDIALETISHGDGRVDPENLSSFVAAYQSVTILKLGELWAIPIMLRLALIENLRRVSARVAADRIERNRAEVWADQMTEIAAKDPKSLILTIADMARSNPPMVSSFVAELTRRLHGHGPALALPLTWIEQRLSESGLTIEQLVRSENQQQAADQVSMSNSIGSLRFLSAMDWREFVETMSIVEQTLGEDPADVYAKMDFATRDRYRHVVEETAKSSPLTESEVARQAIQLAHEGAAQKGSGDREAHVGFYLVDKGLAQLKRGAHVRMSLVQVLRSVCRRVPLLLYGGTILLMTVIFAGVLTATAYAGGVHGWALGCVGLLSLLCASHLAVALVNWLATLLATPRLLPRMDFSKGIPHELRTLVVVPTMLTSAQNIEELIEALEVRFLANRDDRLHFALLTDFCDAAEETLPEDGPLLRLARQGIEELNNKYCSAADNIFFLFHRPRRFNPMERLWMGHERKRGKLADLNRLLRGGSRDRFALVVGDTTVLSNVKYVITLDTDTQLARDSAWQFVGAMAHPLNRARYDENRQRVVEGYGILQPRVAASLSGTNRSRYARMCASEPGIDPYTRAVSDVYQDLFGEGSFIGKGIYEVDAFERSLGGRFPDNRILSHDLLEGCYARAGLLSDVQLYEEYPSRYSADVSRRHRWIRGDWQIARWLLPGIPGPDGASAEEPALDAVALENLRQPAAQSDGRGLDTAAAVGLDRVVAGLVLDLGGDRHHPDSLFDRFGPECASEAGRCVPGAAPRRRDALGRPALRSRLLYARVPAIRGVFQPGCDRAHRLADADHAQAAARMESIGRLGSHRAARTSSARAGPCGSPRVIAAAAATILAVSKPATLAVAGPILGLWFASPAIAWWISRPLARRRERLTVDQTLFLRKLSRKTWAFFETFVGPDDHWLPPGQLSGASGSPWSRIAPLRPTWDLRCWRICPHTILATISAGKLIERTREGAPHHGSPGTAPGPLLSTGTTRNP